MWRYADSARAANRSIILDRQPNCAVRPLRIPGIPDMYGIIVVIVSHSKVKSEASQHRFHLVE
jgi:hypothetical protein